MMNKKKNHHHRCSLPVRKRRSPIGTGGANETDIFLKIEEARYNVARAKKKTGGGMGASEQELRGQAIYTKFTLSLYDWLVHGFCSKYIWNVDSETLQNMYDTHMSTKTHLDIGPGTGFFLKNKKITSITLLDLNLQCLAACKMALESRHVQVECHRMSVFDPTLQTILPRHKFDSIGMNFLFHCLPNLNGPKWTILDNIIPSLSDDGVLFGSTICSIGVNPSRSAQWLMALYNWLGIFSNQEDARDDLLTHLRQRFHHVEHQVQGCVVIFEARRPMRK